MRLILIGLVPLVTLSIFVMLGFGSGGLGDLRLNPSWNSKCYYDVDGHALFFANLTACGEAGKVVGLSYGFDDFAYWYNGTNLAVDSLIFPSYKIYSDNFGNQPAKLSVINNPQMGEYSGISIQTSLGFIALIVAIMALAVVTGIHVLGSGIGEEATNAILKGTAYVAIWGVFSVPTVPLFVLLGTIGSVLYFVLALCYTLGVINSFGHPSGDD